jgi:hypothetical protein
LHSTTFGHANSVSSNISGSVSHLVEMLSSWSSSYYKISWITAVFAFILADIVPSTICVEIGLKATDNSFPITALPPNSIYSNYSEPFIMTNEIRQISVDIAPMYFNPFLSAGSYVTVKPPGLNAPIP